MSPSRVLSLLAVLTVACATPVRPVRPWTDCEEERTAVARVTQSSISTLPDSIGGLTIILSSSGPSAPQLARASVTLLIAEEVRNESVTDSEGRISVTLSAGEYRTLIRALRHLPASLTVRVRGGYADTLAVALHPLSGCLIRTSAAFAP
jgi:hypothetical protein